MEMLFGIHDLICPGSGKYVKTTFVHEGVSEERYDHTTENVCIIDTAVPFDAVDAITTEETSQISCVCFTKALY